MFCLYCLLSLASLSLSRLSLSLIIPSSILTHCHHYFLASFTCHSIVTGFRFLQRPACTRGQHATRLPFAYTLSLGTAVLDACRTPPAFRTLCVPLLSLFTTTFAIPTSRETTAPAAPNPAHPRSAHLESKHFILNTKKARPTGFVSASTLLRCTEPWRPHT